MHEPLNPNHVLRQKLNYFYSNFIDKEPEALRCQVSYPPVTQLVSSRMAGDLLPMER